MARDNRDRVRIQRDHPTWLVDDPMESRVAASSPPLSRNWPPEEDGKSALRVEIDEVMKVFSL